MEIDPEKLKRQTKYFLGIIKSLETEVVAYRVLFHVLRQNEAVPYLDEGLQLAKNKAAEGMDQKYNQLSERLLRTVDQVDLDQELAKFLKEWNPEGPAN